MEIEETKDLEKAIGLFDSLFGYTEVGEADGEAITSDKAAFFQAAMKAALGDNRVPSINVLRRAVYGSALTTPRAAEVADALAYIQDACHLCLVYIHMRWPGSKANEAPKRLPFMRTDGTIVLLDGKEWTREWNGLRGLEVRP